MKIAEYLKNSIGPRTNRKIVTFSVDDYGVQRTANKEAYRAMEKAGMDLHSNRFDRLDSLETPEDLSYLWETLDSVRDKNGNPAIFTAFACPANIDFDFVRDSKGDSYKYITLPALYTQLGYSDMMNLWQEGIDAKVMNVQYHGREHVNLRTLLELLRAGDKQVWTAIKNNSWSGISHKVSPNISYVSAVQFEDKTELPLIADILTEGTDIFENVWGYRPIHFTAPGNRENSYIHPFLAKMGVKYIDTNLYFKEHQGNGVYKTKVHLPYSKNKLGQHFVIRNMVFEPMLQNESFDWEGYFSQKLKMIFSHGKPVNISTHRVNFGGNLLVENREKHLALLKRILKRIVNDFPDVEFMSTVDMASIMTER